MDWHRTFGRHFEINDASGHRKGWSGYSWDTALFPDPKDFLTELHKEGLKVTLISIPRAACSRGKTPTSVLPGR